MSVSALVSLRSQDGTCSGPPSLHSVPWAVLMSSRSEGSDDPKIDRTAQPLQTPRRFLFNPEFTST